MNENGKARTVFNEGSDQPQFFSPVDETNYLPMEYLVGGLIPKGYPAMLFGDGGSLKSITSQHLGISIASEEVTGWLGRDIPTLPVLNLEFEQDQESHNRRGVQIARGLNISTPPTQEYLATLGCAGFNLWEAGPLALEWAYDTCYQREREGVLILDSLGYALPGKLEDQETAIRFYNEFLVPLKECRVTPIIVHHTPKYSKVPYGSVYLVRNNFRSQWRLEETGNDLRTAKAIRMEDIKRNNTGKSDDIFIRGIFDEEDIPEGEKAIWITRKSSDEFLNGEGRVRQIVDAIYGIPLPSTEEEALKTTEIINRLASHGFGKDKIRDVLKDKDNFYNGIETTKAKGKGGGYAYYLSLPDPGECSSKEGSENTDVSTDNYTDGTFLTDRISKDQERRKVAKHFITEPLRTLRKSSSHPRKSRKEIIYEDIGSHPETTREEVAERTGIELNIIESRVSELIKEERIDEWEEDGRRIIDHPW